MTEKIKPPDIVEAIKGLKNNLEVKYFPKEGSVITGPDVDQTAEELHLDQRDLEMKMKEEKGVPKEVIKGLDETAALKIEEERKSREEFEQAKKEFNENERKIAENRAKAYKKVRGIFEALGVLPKKGVMSEEIMEYVNRRNALYQKLRDSGSKALKGNKEELEDFLTDYDMRIIAIRSRTQEGEIRAQNSKWYDKAFVQFANIGKNYREFIAKKGLIKGIATAAAISLAVTSVIAASLPALGIAAVGAAGSAAWGMRIFGAVGAGYAAKKRMEAGLIEKTKKKVEEDVLRKIEALKNKTYEEWKQFVEGMEGGTSIEKEEQTFTSKDRKHKLMALGLASGTFLAGTIASHYAADIRASAKGYFSQAWDHLFGSGTKTGPVFEPSHGSLADADMYANTHGAVTPEGAGKGAAVISEVAGEKGPGVTPETQPEKSMLPTGDKYSPASTGLEHTGHEEFSGDTTQIKKDESIWKCTRELYMKHPEDYGFRADDPKIEKLFQSFERQGILERLGIDTDNFSDLSDEEKIKIWAENRTANSVKQLAELQGGKIKGLVHPEDSITLTADGKILFGETSGIKAGPLHAEPIQGTGRAATETYGSGRKISGLEQYDEQIRSAKAGELAAQNVLDENMRLKREILYPEYQQASAHEASMMDMNINYNAINKIASEALGNPFLPQQQMSEIAGTIGQQVAGVFPEGSETLTYAQQQARTNGVNFLKALIGRYPYGTGENYRDYLARIPLEAMNNLRKKYNL